MSVRVGSARSSYGNTARGDQSGGKEVSTQSWYLHSLGWYYLEPINPDDAERIAYAMQAACDNDLIGYDQDTRMTLNEAIKSKGYDPKLCTVKVNTDCSALVRVCCLYAGINAEKFNTSDEVSKLMATGKFRKYTDDKHCKSQDYLKRGGILVTRSKGHTVVVLTDGKYAAKDEKPSAPEVIDSVTVNNGKYYVRTAPTSAESNFLTINGAVQIVRDGDVLKIHEHKNGWYHFTHGTKGYTGYCSDKAVKK